MSIARSGYVCVSQCIDNQALEILRKEADHLFRLKCARGVLSEDEYFDKGCALDFFTNNELPEDDEARKSMGTYMSKRNSAPSKGIDRSYMSSSGEQKPAQSRPRSPESDCSDADTNKTCGENNPNESWCQDHHVAIIREVIFGRLAHFAWEALESERCARAQPDDEGGQKPIARGNSSMTRSEECAAIRSQPPMPSALRSCSSPPTAERLTLDPGNTTDKRTPICPADAGQGLLLFNEQYVVKPPQSSIEFGWHTDEREQLAMCVGAPGVPPPVYVSVWLALDDCDAVNGCLEVCPQHVIEPRVRAPSQGDEAQVVGLPSKAGDAVVFLSNLWHRSGPNRSPKPRRVFYAQYSRDVIRATPSDPRPLSLAIPCLVHASSAPTRAAALSASSMAETSNVERCTRDRIDTLEETRSTAAGSSNRSSPHAASVETVGAPNKRRKQHGDPPVRESKVR